MTLADVLFLIFGGTICVGAAGVVFTQAVARMALWLVLTLTASAGLFFLLGAEFVGIVQLLVYVGGTLVLLVFGVMMTGSGLTSEYRTRAVEVVTAGVLAIGLIGLMLNSVLATPWSKLADASPARPPVSTLEIGLALAGVPQSKPEVGRGEIVSSRQSPGYLLPFELLSVHLLVVLVGAAYLARAKRRANTTEQQEVTHADQGGAALAPESSPAATAVRVLPERREQWSPTN
jgi:NADH-quinone oxidoreductase subunit J